jgi:ribonucleoside-diphosphate reductase alpha chain
VEVKQELSSVRITPSTHLNGTQSTQPQKQQKVAAKVDAGLDAVNAAAKTMQSDAPSCSTCGHITIRSGTCYKCMNCGTSMGCS